MLSKAKIKFVKSLQIKKYRKQEQCFVVEGAKSVQELLNSDFDTVLVLTTKDFQSHNKLPASAEVIEVTARELEGIGEFQSNDSVLAVARIPDPVDPAIGKDEFVLVLDDIRDPGNLGTIIRAADWFGIKTVIASPETADFYSSKVITATMGSFTRVGIFYTDLSVYMGGLQDGRIFGAFLDGKNIHHVNFGTGGHVIIGNESRGISADLTRFVTDKITIPRFGKAESLNAAMATAIICDVMRSGGLGAGNRG